MCYFGYVELVQVISGMLMILCYIVLLSLVDCEKLECFLYFEGLDLYFVFDSEIFEIVFGEMFWYDLNGLCLIFSLCDFIQVNVGVN